MVQNTNPLDDGHKIVPEMLGAGGPITAAEMENLTLSQIAAIKGLPVEILADAINQRAAAEAASVKWSKRENEELPAHVEAVKGGYIIGGETDTMDETAVDKSIMKSAAQEKPIDADDAPADW